MSEKEYTIRETIKKDIIHISVSDDGKSIYIKNEGEHYNLYIRKKFLQELIEILRGIDNDINS